MTTTGIPGTLLRRAVAEVIVEEELGELLVSGRKLRLKEGFDPSAPDIHLGHMVGLRKLREFQELGHQVVLIVGDWTAQIGDPSGASATRPMLSAEQVKVNADTYMKQFFTIVDRERTEVRWQSEWFGEFDLADVIRLTSRFTVAQMLARDDFNSRYTSGRPIAVTEFLYPLLQAYDSVAIQADVEFGGTDQKFNLLVGRELQSQIGQRPQQCFMSPMLVGTDGSQKMSKSLGNYIGVAEPPETIYGKTMSIRDDLILQYLELVTDVPDEELAGFARELEAAAVNPMDLKKRLARELVTQLYGSEAAAGAAAHFERVHQKRQMPDQIEERRVHSDKVTVLRAGHEYINFPKLLVQTGLAGTASEANRLITQAGTTLITQIGSDISETPISERMVEKGMVPDRSVIRRGKRHFVRVVYTETEPPRGAGATRHDR